MMTRAKRGRLESANTEEMNENRENTETENAQATEEPEVTRNEQESVEIITIDDSIMEQNQVGAIISSSDDDIEITSVSGPRRVDLTNIPTQPAETTGDLFSNIRARLLIRPPHRRKRKRDFTIQNEEPITIDDTIVEPPSTNNQRAFRLDEAFMDEDILDMIDDEIRVTSTLPRMPPMRPVVKKTPKSSNKIPTPAAPEPSTSSAPKSNNEMDPCPICMDDFGEVKAAGKKLVVTKCGHFVCDACFKQLTKIGGRPSTTFTCPSCRKKQKTSSANTLHI